MATAQAGDWTSDWSMQLPKGPAPPKVWGSFEEVLRSQLSTCDYIMAAQVLRNPASSPCISLPASNPESTSNEFLCAT